MGHANTRDLLDFGVMEGWWLGVSIWALNFGFNLQFAIGFGLCENMPFCPLFSYFCAKLGLTGYTLGSQFCFNLIEDFL